MTALDVPDPSVVGEELPEQLVFALGRGEAVYLPEGGHCYEVRTTKGVLRIVEHNDCDPVDIFLDGELITLGVVL